MAELEEFVVNEIKDLRHKLEKAKEKYKALETFLKGDYAELDIVFSEQEVHRLHFKSVLPDGKYTKITVDALNCGDFSRRALSSTERGYHNA